MGSLVQIKSDTHMAWMGGFPNSDWTDLKISTIDPQQSSQICPMLDDSSFCEWNKGLNVQFLKEKGDLFSFQCKLLQHFQDMGMDTSMYLKNPRDPAKLVNLLMDHTQFTQAYIKTAIKEHHKLYDSYDWLRNHGACYVLWTALTQPSRCTSRLVSLMTLFPTHLDAVHQGPAKQLTQTFLYNDG